MKLLDSDLEHIATAARAASQGPYKVQREDDMHGEGDVDFVVKNRAHDVCVMHGEIVTVPGATLYNNSTVVRAQADAQYFATVPPDTVITLIEEVQHLRKLVRRRRKKKS